MKSLVILVFAGCTLVCAQPPASAQAPATIQAPKAGAGQAPPPLPDLPDSAVIAEFPDHSTFTMGEVRKYISALPADNQAVALRDPKAWIQGWSQMLQMARLAEKEKLGERSPYKEQLEFQRLLFLAQSEISDKSNNIMVDGEEIAKAYDAHKDKYKQVKVNAIYIAFGEKGVTDAQAKAKAEKLLAQIRKGADFAKLARENSDDETSRAKDGYFATLTPSDNIPDALRAAVFQLKQGETSEPIRQPNGFYLLRAEQVGYKPLSEVRDQVFTELKNQKLQDWFREMEKQAKPKFVNPKFLGDQ